MGLLMRRLVFFSLVSVVCFFTACGNDSANNGTTNAKSSDADSYATIDDLPNCTANRDGVVAFVEDGDASYVCKENNWLKAGNVYKSEDDFPNCTENRRGESVLDQSDGEVYTCNGKSWEKNSAEGKDAESSSSAGSSGSESKNEEKSSSSVSPDDSVLVDSRDGRVYKIVTIGPQTWMAENLNFETSNSYCYNDSAEYCSKYGRLYTWAAAMDSAGMWSENGKGCGYGIQCKPIAPVQGVCPGGWHLPRAEEIEKLFNLVGGKSTVGWKLKSTSGWYDDGNGTDEYGFSALPGGVRVSTFIYSGELSKVVELSEFVYEGELSRFWNADERPSCEGIQSCKYDNALQLRLEYDRTDALGGYDTWAGYDKSCALSVRCLKDD